MTTPASDDSLGSSTGLRLVDAVAQSVGFMGPVFSIAFLVPLVMGITSATGNGAGVAAPLAVLIAAIGVLGFGWIVAEYARRIHAAGSLYDYVTDGLGIRAGGASGFLYYAGVFALGAAILVMLGGTIHDTLSTEFNHTFLPEAGWDIVLLAIACVTVFYGVSLSTRTQLTLAVISITVVTIFFVYVIIKVGSDNDVAKTLNPSNAPNGFSGIMYGVLYGVLLFTGFETAANLGEETHHPARDIPRAVLFSVLGITGFYLVGTYAQIAGFGFDLNAIGQAAGAPLFALASPASAGGYGSVAVVRLMELVVMLDMLAVMIGCATAGSRGLFALGRDGRLPRALGKPSARGVPVVAGVVLMVLYAITIAITIQVDEPVGHRRPAALRRDVQRARRLRVAGHGLHLLPPVRRCPAWPLRPPQAMGRRPRCHRRHGRDRGRDLRRGLQDELADQLPALRRGRDLPRRPRSLQAGDDQSGGTPRARQRAGEAVRAYVTRILLNTWRRQGRVLGPVLRDMHGVEVAYSRAVEDAGALPFLLPRPAQGVGVETVLRGFDGLLLIGGEDLSADVERGISGEHRPQR